MTASEFAFLALGLTLGLASGAALVEVFRARPPAREVRVTVAPNSIHARRAVTLAENAFSPIASGPAAGGPGDRRWTDRGPTQTAIPAGARRLPAASGRPPPHGDLIPDIRTPVRVGSDIAGPSGPGQAVEPSRSALFWLSPASNSSAIDLVAVPIELEPDPLTQALRATAARVAVVAMRGGDTDAARPAPAPGATSGSGPVDPASGTAPVKNAGGPAGGGAPPDGGPCAEERRVADERCAVAARAREGASGAAEALRAAHRAHDGHVGNAETAANAIDPRAVRAAKESAQRRFREARAAATTRDDVEAAARTWLGEINRINRDTREVSLRIERDRAAAAALAPILDRLAVEADAARIAAQRAEEACVAAREAVAACDEARLLEAAAAAAGRPPRSDTPQPERIAAAMPAPEDEFGPAMPMGSRAGEEAVLLRILRGDREAMLLAVAKLAGDDPEARRRWQRWLSSLAEALIARSIEASAFDFPDDHFFWSMFNQTQRRDIASALSSLGHHFDGFGGWVDERSPTQRDLSLAVGYAGLDPMRIRRWPTEPEMVELMADIRVAADEYVAAAAGGLTLGELVTLLGRRADALTELWNEWGIARPVLLEAM